MTDEHHLEPISNVEVAALLVTCGMCGSGVLIEYEALDTEAGRVKPELAFEDCRECGFGMDATAATFSAMLAAREGGR